MQMYIFNFFISREENDIRTRKKLIDVFYKAISNPKEEVKINLFKSITNVICQSHTVVSGCIDFSLPQNDAEWDDSIDLGIPVQTEMERIPLGQCNLVFHLGSTVVIILIICCTLIFHPCDIEWN